ncbi:MAG: hemolysin XhlA family protein [Firmicutes bacterium]|jgi:hypothetical protein|nr:hemolysin XhlA family protein [Bacillota bacterium]DAZ19443.1 MAG TPA: hemolysin [Caudoviricetes sp.]
MENGKFQIEVLERLSVLETLIKEQDYKGVKDTSEKALNLAKNNESRINALEDGNKWLIRLVIGAIIGGILAFVFKI